VSPGANLPDRIAVAAEVYRALIMEGIVDEDRDLEVDSLTDGKPMELIPQHRSDVIKLPLKFVRDQPGCRIQDRLQSSDDNACGTIENAVAIVDTT